MLVSAPTLILTFLTHPSRARAQEYAIILVMFDKIWVIGLFYDGHLYINFLESHLCGCTNSSNLFPTIYLCTFKLYFFITINFNNTDTQFNKIILLTVLYTLLRIPITNIVSFCLLNANFIYVYKCIDFFFHERVTKLQKNHEMFVEKV